MCDKTAVLMQCCDGLAPLGELTGQPFPPTGEHKCKRLCLSRSGHKGVIRSGMKMTDDRAGGEEMRVWSVAVIAERK